MMWPRNFDGLVTVTGSSHTRAVPPILRRLQACKPQPSNVRVRVPSPVRIMMRFMQECEVRVCQGLHR